MMPYPQFTDEQVTEFIEQAAEMGIGPAMRMLGYPKSYHTAKKWHTQRNIDMPTANTLAVIAKQLDIFYTDREKVLASEVNALALGVKPAVYLAVLLIRNSSI